MRVKPDYAKWMLDDPRVNFAISLRGSYTGINRLGLQVDDEHELKKCMDASTAPRAPSASPKRMCLAATLDPTSTGSRTLRAWPGRPSETWAQCPFYGQADAAAEQGDDACCTPQPSIGTAALPRVAAKSCCGPTTASSGRIYVMLLEGPSRIAMDAPRL